MPDLKSKVLITSLILFLFSFALRMALMSKGAYSSDCLNITMQAEKLLDTYQYPYHFGSGYPLTIMIAAVFVALGRLVEVPDTVLAVNFMSVVFGSLCVVLFYYFVRKLLDEATAILSAALLSLCPIFVGVSVYGIGHTPALFLMLLGLLLLMEYFKEGRSRFLLWSGLCMGASGANRVQDLVLFLPALFVFFFLHRHLLRESITLSVKEKIRSFALLLAVCLFVIFLFHLPYILANTRSQYFNQYQYFQSISMFSFTDFEMSRLGFFYNIMFLTQTLSILGMILSVAGLLLWAKERVYLLLFSLVWILAPLYFFCHMAGIVSRHQVLILPPLIMAQCYLLARLVGTGRIVFQFSSIAVFILLIFLTFGHYYPQFLYRHRHSALTDYCRWVGAKTEPNARIITTDAGAFIDRYAKRMPLGRMLHARYSLKPEQLQEYKMELESLLEQGIPIYIVDTGLYTYDPKQIFSGFLKNNFELEYVGTSNYEDWHRDYLQFKVFKNALYRIKRK